MNPWEMDYSGGGNAAPTPAPTTAYNTGNIRGQGGFKSYATAEEGAADHQRLLQLYQSKHGLNTVREVINRWAPPTENNTSNYANYMAKSMGVGLDDKLDFNDPNVLGKFAYYQSRMEKGAKKAPLTEQQMIDVAYQNGAKPWEHKYSDAQQPQEAPKPWEMTYQTANPAPVSNEDVPTPENLAKPPVMPLEAHPSSLGDKATAIGENALSVASGAIAGLAGAGMSAYELLSGNATADPDSAESAVADVVDNLTYHPETSEGKRMQREYVAPVMENLAALGPEFAATKGAEGLTRVGGKAAAETAEAVSNKGALTRVSDLAAQTNKLDKAIAKKQALVDKPVGEDFNALMKRQKAKAQLTDLKSQRESLTNLPKLDLDAINATHDALKEGDRARVGELVKAHPEVGEWLKSQGYSNRLTDLAGFASRLKLPSSIETLLHVKSGGTTLLGTAARAGAKKLTSYAQAKQLSNVVNALNQK